MIGLAHALGIPHIWLAQFRYLHQGGSTHLVGSFYYAVGSYLAPTSDCIRAKGCAVLVSQRRHVHSTFNRKTEVVAGPGRLRGIEDNTTTTAAGAKFKKNGKIFEAKKNTAGLAELAKCPRLGL